MRHVARREALIMVAMSPATLRELIVRTRQRYAEIDRADWDGVRNRRTHTVKWQQAAKEIAPHEWCEFVRILAQGWDYYGGSDLPAKGGEPWGN
jgi:hypothetical protein